MAASPTIKHVSATKNTDIKFTILLSNEGTPGMVLLRGYNYDTGSCIETGSRPICLYEDSEYINNLYTKVLLAQGVVSNTGCVKAFVCTSGDDCENKTCSAYNSSPSSSIENIPVSVGLGVVPNPVTSLSLSPGDQTIAASWTAPSNAPIFCYYVGLFRAGNLVTSGYVTTTQITVGNLTNGVSYTLEVAAVSDDDLSSGVVSENATPTVDCVTPDCTINISSL